MGRMMQPIRDTRVVNRITETLAAREDEYGKRLFALWYIGINMGLRIGDMLNLRVGDLRGVDVFYLEPAKQRHMREAYERKRAEKENRPIRALRPEPVGYTVPTGIRQMMRDRYRDAPDDMPIFASRVKRPGGKARAISRQQALSDMRRIGEIGNLDMKLGCHTLRKTFGYQRYKESRDIAFLQKWFHHASQEITLIYIGMSEEEFRKRTDRSATDIYGK